MTRFRNGAVEPVTLPERETALARATSETLAGFVRGESPLSLRLTNPATGEAVEATVPSIAMRLLAEVLAKLAEGQTVTLVPLHAELSTQQAADLLGVSRPFFVKLLEEGKLPYRKVGEHRRVRYSELLQYLEKERQESHLAFDALVALSEEMGLYEMERTGTLRNRGAEEEPGRERP
ncbi:MAG: helix-turn-helix domain-containing protein [Capsulimonadales bacterium]|nr:helix-turn-helix domain-containing protein [Capsulimonadales bacterium]